jgi:hypothetical protein
MGVDQGNRPGSSSSGISIYDEALDEVADRPSEQAPVIELLSASAAALENAHKELDATQLPLDQGHAACAIEHEESDLTMHLRSYQREMFEQSIRRNVIVTVRTFYNHDIPF